MKKTRNLYHYQIRRCRRVEEYIVNKNIVENCINGDTDLFAEIKKHRKDVEDDVTIDGASGKDIPGKFADVYCELYNRESDNEEVDKIKEEFESIVDEQSFSEVNKIISSSIKEALQKIKLTQFVTFHMTS